MSHAKSSGLRKMALTKSGHSKAGSITDMGGIYRTNIYGLMRKKVVHLTLSDVFLRKFERLRPPSCYPFALLLLGGFRSFQSQFLRDFDPLTSILK